MGYKEKISEKVTFNEVGMILEGKLLGKVHLDALNCEQWQMQLLGSPEESVTTFLGTTILDRLLDGEIGNMVKIEYTGDAKTRSSRNIKQFKVWADDGQQDDGDAAAKLAEATTKTPDKKKK